MRLLCVQVGQLATVLDGANMSKLDLSGANLQGVSLLQTKLTGANLAGACLEEALMRGAGVERAGEVGHQRGVLTLSYFVFRNVDNTVGTAPFLSVNAQLAEQRRIPSSVVQHATRTPAKLKLSESKRTRHTLANPLPQTLNRARARTSATASP